MVLSLLCSLSAFEHTSPHTATPICSVPFSLTVSVWLSLTVALCELLTSHRTISWNRAALTSTFHRRKTKEGIKRQVLCFDAHDARVSLAFLEKTMQLIWLSHRYYHIEDTQNRIRLGEFSPWTSGTRKKKLPLKQLLPWSSGPSLSDINSLQLQL